MRLSLWLMLLACCLAVPLLAERSEGQSPVFPIGRPFTFASGFSTPIQNVPIDTTRNVVVPVPQQRTGMFLPDFRRLMRFPNHNVVNGVSPMPAPASFPGANMPNALNPFGSAKK